MKKIFTFDFKNSLQSKITMYICGHQDLDKIHENDRVYIYYSDINRRLCLFRGYLEDGLPFIKDLLINRVLHESTKKPLGLLYQKWHELDNMKRLKDKDFFVFQEDGFECWDGEQCLLFAIDRDKHHSVTWLYKKKKEDRFYIFEIAPMYPWASRDPEDVKNYIPYKKWEKNYKTILSTTVDEEVVKEWAKRLELFYSKIMPYDCTINCLDDYCKCRPYRCCLYPKKFEAFDYERPEKPSYNKKSKN